MIQTSVRLQSGLRLFLAFLPIMVLMIHFLKEGEVRFNDPILLMLLVSLIASMKLNLELTQEGFSYRMPFLHWRKQTIHWQDVAEAEIVKITPLGDFLGWGIRWSSKYGWSYVLSEGDFLRIRMKSGKKRGFSLGKDQAFKESLERRLSLH